MRSASQPPSAEPEGLEQKKEAECRAADWRDKSRTTSFVELVCTQQMRSHGADSVECGDGRGERALAQVGFRYSTSLCAGGSFTATSSFRSLSLRCSARKRLLPRPPGLLRVAASEILIATSNGPASLSPHAQAIPCRLDMPIHRANRTARDGSRRPAMPRSTSPRHATTSPFNPSPTSGPQVPPRNQYRIGGTRVLG